MDSNAPPDVAVSGTAHVSVQVRSYVGDGAAVAGASVRFASADGTTVAETTTDAAGAAQLDGPSGGLLIVSQPSADADIAAENTVIAGVRDGDALTVGLGNVLPSEDTASIDFPPNPGGATRYSIEGACVSGQSSVPSITGYLTPGCPANRTVVAAAEHGTDAPDFLVAHDVALEPDAIVTLTGTWAAAAPATITATGFPDDAMYVELHRYALAAEGAPVWSHTLIATPAAGTASASLVAPAGAGTRQMVFSEYRLAADTYYTFSYAEGALGDQTFDSGSQLPRMTRPTPGAATWTVGPGTADGIWTQAASVDAESGLPVRWRFVLPPDATALPQLAGVTFQGGAYGAIVDASTLSGYDDYRRIGGTSPTGVPFAYPIPAGVRFAVRYF